MAVAGDKVRGIVLRGMRPDDIRNRAPLASAIEGTPQSRERNRALCRADDDKPIDWGSLKGFGDDSLVIIGRRFADLMNLKVGDSLQVVSPVSVATPLGVMPRSAAVNEGCCSRSQEKLRTRPFHRHRLPGIIESDGTIDRGAQNLPATGKAPSSTCQPPCGRPFQDQQGRHTHRHA